MSEKKIFVIDRFEGKLAVCISDDDDVAVVSVSDLEGLMPRDVFNATWDGERFRELTPMPEERDRRLNNNRARLQALARKSKNRNS